MWIYPAYSDTRSLSAELGVEVEYKQINLFEGKNFELSFLELNPNGTLPTLTSDTGVYTDTKSVVSYLNNTLPHPVAKATDFTDLIHKEEYDPNFALLLAVGEPVHIILAPG